jgi:hypothetical protein
MVEQARNGTIGSPVSSTPLSPFAMTLSEIQVPFSPVGYHLLPPRVDLHFFHRIILGQAELLARGVSKSSSSVRSVWGNHRQLADLLLSVRRGICPAQDWSPSPPPSPPFVNPGAYADSTTSNNPGKPSDSVTRQPAAPSAFAQHVNALLFPGLPQVLRQPFIFQDAVVGAVLMMVTAYGWLLVLQEPRNYLPLLAASSNSSADELPGLSDIALFLLRFWPLLLHVVSLFHFICMK